MIIDQKIYFSRGNPKGMKYSGYYQKFGKNISSLRDCTCRIINFSIIISSLRDFYPRKHFSYSETSLLIRVLLRWQYEKNKKYCKIFNSGHIVLIKVALRGKRFILFISAPRVARELIIIC